MLFFFYIWYILKHKVVYRNVRDVALIPDMYMVFTRTD